MSFPHPDREKIFAFLLGLREEILAKFTEIEAGSCFERESWHYQKGEGGGEIAQLRGKIFEKAAVNWSKVAGDAYPLDPTQGAFFATGVSLITHMTNPHVPTTHFNIRFIETEKGYWFGGGYDLSPMGFSYEEDTAHFHASAKRSLDPFGEELYPRFSQWAKEYFYIRHRQRERGVGGIFFDGFNRGNFEADYGMWQSVGNSFLGAILPIYERRIGMAYTPFDRELQLTMRAHYAEFNFLYDKGTEFGFKSQGNPKAILSSMPPLVKW